MTKGKSAPGFVLTGSWAPDGDVSRADRGDEPDLTTLEILDERLLLLLTLGMPRPWVKIPDVDTVGGKLLPGPVFTGGRAPDGKVSNVEGRDEPGRIRPDIPKGEPLVWLALEVAKLLTGPSDFGGKAVSDRECVGTLFGLVIGADPLVGISEDFMVLSLISGVPLPEKLIDKRPGVPLKALTDDAVTMALGNSPGPDFRADVG